MIVYESRKFCDIFCGVRGSVLPFASIFALVSAALAVFLKLLEERDVLKVHNTVNDNAAFSIYTGALAFLLVFRTSKCYSRFWHCATAACTFRTQLLEAASSLISFPLISKHPLEEVDHFRRSIVTYISLLHATALGHVSSCELKTFQVINYCAVSEKHRRCLEGHSFRNRVDLVYMWMNALVVLNTGSGLLNIPPPILSRVFQEMEKAMVEYNQMLEVMSIPFPFPYAQCAIVLLVVVGVFVPFAMCSWTEHPASAGVLTFVAIECLVSLELIASELENPFGEDPNDLPIEEFQNVLNESLMLMISPDAFDFPTFTFDISERRGANAVGPLMKANEIIEASIPRKSLRTSLCRAPTVKEIKLESLKFPF
mmetsp:Transcript_84312/g.132824  ORF Transcript_84312/g.132824 Transcript_84312/m.132824 type:complete len:370 (+) Transcript_84312:61-1170(+)